MSSQKQAESTMLVDMEKKQKEEINPLDVVGSEFGD